MPQQEKPEFRTPVSEEPFPTPIFEEQHKNHVLEPFIILAKHKNLILLTVAAAAIVSAAISLVLTKSYTANARILPPQESSSIAGAMLGQLGPLLGAAAGKDLGLRNLNFWVQIFHPLSCFLPAGFCAGYCLLFSSTALLYSSPLP